MPLSKISEHELIFLAFDFVPFYQIFPINICACMWQTVLAGTSKSLPIPMFLQHLLEGLLISPIPFSITHPTLITRIAMWHTCGQWYEGRGSK